MVSILNELTRSSPSRVELTVEGDGIEALFDVSVSHLVISKAAETGLYRPGISNAGGVYPVDADGKTDDDLMLGKRGAASKYRRDFVVLAGI